MPRKSKFQDREAVENAVIHSSSMTEALERLGLRAAGGNYKQLHKYCELYNLPVPLNPIGSHRLKKAREKNTLDPQEVLCENSEASRTSVKYHFSKISDRTICDICKVKEWLGQPLIIQLDHINGIHNDNRPENLRWLCPNCHSQTDTFCSKNLGE